MAVKQFDNLSLDRWIVDKTSKPAKEQESQRKWEWNEQTKNKQIKYYYLNGTFSMFVVVK